MEARGGGAAATQARRWADPRTETPLRSATLRVDGLALPVSLKLEQHNPSGSIKYRTALGLVAALDAVDPLTPATTVIESTSGNLGLALSRVLAEVGCRVVVVVDPKLSPSVEAELVAAGVELVRVTQRDVHGGYLLSRLARVQDLLREHPGWRWADQYQNPASPDVFTHSFAPELLDQCGGRVDTLVMAVGTGASLAGTSRGLRDREPNVRVCAVDVVGSLVTSDEGGPHLLTGIGATRKSSFLGDGAAFDRAVRVRDVDAIAVCRAVRDSTEMVIGGSSGATLAAAIKLSSDRGAPAGHPVVVLADGGTHYVRTLYDDGWLEAKGVLDDVRAAMEILHNRGVSVQLETDTRG